MNRVVLQEGYAIPFNGVRRKKRKSGRKITHPAMKKQQSKMQVCAKRWSGDGSYKAYMTHCLRKK